MTPTRREAGKVHIGAVKRFRPGRFNVRTRKWTKQLMYGCKGEEIAVLRWIRWPSYDFIFGVPEPTSKYYKDERGFFQYRDSRKGRRGACLYLDLGELREMVDGFTTLLKHAESRRPSPGSGKR